MILVPEIANTHFQAFTTGFLYKSGSCTSSFFVMLSEGILTWSSKYWEKH